jgi:hypothetical protein
LLRNGYSSASVARQGLREYATTIACSVGGTVGSNVSCAVLSGDIYIYIYTHTHTSIPGTRCHSPSGEGPAGLQAGRQLGAARSW